MRVIRDLTISLSVALFVGCGAQPSSTPKQAPEQKSVTAAPKATATTNTAKPKTEPKPAAKPQPKPQAKPAEPKFAVVKEWDFGKLPKEQWEWYFPGNRPVASPKGAYYYLTKSAPGPQLRGSSIAADEATHVRVDMDLTLRAAKDEKTPFKFLILYFNGSEGKPADEKWPFDNKWTARFKPVPNNPGVYEAKLTGHPNWKGNIEDFFISVAVPELSADQLKNNVSYGCRVRKISFIKKDGPAATAPAPAKAKPAKAPETAAPTAAAAVKPASKPAAKPAAKPSSKKAAK